MEVRDRYRIPTPWEVAALAWCLASIGLTAFILNKFKLRTKNFRGSETPVGDGLYLVLPTVPIFAVLAWLWPWRSREGLAYAVVVGCMGLLGFLDDVKGDRSASGIRGHLKQALHGKMTTGFLKAAGGLAISLLVARFILQRSWIGTVVDGTIIALSANALNLLDLRPGRAGTVFLIGALLLTLYSWDYRSGPPALMLLAFPLMYIYVSDRAGEVMMGDVGSNSLGGALGLAFVLAVHSPAGRLAALAALIGLHVLAEKVSISAVIERNPILRRLDRLTGVR